MKYKPNLDFATINSNRKNLNFAAIDSNRKSNRNHYIGTSNGTESDKIITSKDFGTGDVVIERLPDNTLSDGIITTNGDQDAGILCADFFKLEKDTILGSFMFRGGRSSNRLEIY